METLENCLESRAAPPWLTEPGWLPLKKFAEQWHRSPKTVYQWIMNGTLAAAKIRVYRDIGGRWWIRPPNP